MNRQKLYVFISSIVGLLSTLMPFVSASAFGVSHSASAVDSNGGKFILLLFAVICALCFVGNKQEKFTQPFIYGVWASSATNILLFIMLVADVNKMNRYTFGLRNVNIAHGAYLTFLAAVAIILFTVEKLALVNKIDNFIASKKNVKSSEPMVQEVPVKDVVASVPVNVVETAEVKEVAQVVEENTEETAQVVEKVAEVVIENNDKTTSDSDEA